MSRASPLFRDLLVETKDGEWGSSTPAPEHVEMRVIRGTDFSDVRGGELSAVPVRYIPRRIAERKRLRPADILIETAGGTRDQPTGRSVFLKSRLFTSSPLPMTCASFSRFLRVNADLAEPEFIYWYLQYLYQTGQMDEHQVQHTGVARFQYTRFAASTFVPLPGRGDQRAIADILGTLDDKIELNRRMNQTLEAMVEAIFKSWFVDFDPVCAKAEGRQPAGMDAETAALFPDAFEESQSGKIPRGWRPAPLDEVADFRNGLAMQRFPATDGGSLPVVKIAELNRGDTVGADRANADLNPLYVVDDGDVLFSWSGSLTVRIWCGGRGALNQHLFKVTSASFPRWFYYCWLLEHLPDFQLIAAGKATTMGHIQRHHLHDATVVVPPRPLLDRTSQFLEPLLGRFVANNVESRTLAALRDALLPKLLSGEVRVPQASRSER